MKFYQAGKFWGVAIIGLLLCVAFILTETEGKQISNIGDGGEDAFGGGGGGGWGGGGDPYPDHGGYPTTSTPKPLPSETSCSDNYDCIKQVGRGFICIEPWWPWFYGGKECAPCIKFGEPCRSDEDCCYNKSCVMSKCSNTSATTTTPTPTTKRYGGDGDWHYKQQAEPGPNPVKKG